MRVLLDECVPQKLRYHLHGHEVRTVADMQWSGTKNGRLLRQAAAEFDVFLTVDQGIEFQQNLVGVDIAIVILVARSNTIDELRPLVARASATIHAAIPGEVIILSG